MPTLLDVSRIAPRRGAGLRVALLAVLIAGLFLAAAGQAAQRGRLVDTLQQRLGLTEPQVRGALGALLVYAEQHLSKDDFDLLAQSVPNAERIMQDVKLHGIVTRPLDDIGDYEAALASLGIGQPLASQFAPAVLDWLGASGHDAERDVLGKIL